MLNKLLLQQLKEHLKDPDAIPENISPLLEVISKSYDAHQNACNMLEHSAEESSKALINLSNKLDSETAELKKAHDNLKKLFENIDEAFFSVSVVFNNQNPSFSLLQMSAACESIYGYTPAEFMSRENLWQDVIHPEDKHIAAQHVNDLHQGKLVFNQYRIIHKDESIRWIENKITPTMDENGKLIRLDGVTSDITTKKLSAIERDKITSDLIRQNKDLEQFAYIISHNLRAPVANILGLSQIIQTENLDEYSYKTSMKGLSSSVQKLDNIIIDLGRILQVKREINEKKEIVQFSRLVDDIKLSVRNFLEEEEVLIHTDFSLINELFTLKSYLHSIFYNLISNSIKYSAPDRKPVIEITSRETDNAVVIVFKDNGSGIDLKTNGDKIFGLYKRFHANVEGRGMGLFMVKTQVETLSGKIGVSSEINRGTEFILEFPKQTNTDEHEAKTNNKHNIISTLT